MTLLQEPDGGFHPEKRSRVFGLRLTYRSGKTHVIVLNSARVGISWLVHNWANILYAAILRQRSCSNCGHTWKTSPVGSSRSSFFPLLVVVTIGKAMDGVSRRIRLNTLSTSFASSRNSWALK